MSASMPTTPRIPTSVFLNIFNNNPYLYDSEGYWEAKELLISSALEHQEKYDGDYVTFVMASPHVVRKHTGHTNANTINTAQRRLFN